MVDLTYDTAWIKDRCFMCSHSLPSDRDRNRYYEKYGNACLPCLKDTSDSASARAHKRLLDSTNPLRERPLPEDVQEALRKFFNKEREKYVHVQSL